MNEVRHNDEGDPAADPGRRLFHRWFVEYNPVYLLSASLVLAGMMLLSRGLTASQSLYGGLGVTAVAELYALSLIGGAALLMRLGQRRPAVMLAVLAMFYQGDLTLHTDSCPGLGWAGALAACGWLALFFAKMAALARAMKLRLSRAVIATLALGALGLTALPYGLPSMTPRAASSLVMIWLFALTYSQRAGAVASAEDLGDWGQTVLGRAVGVSWGFLALLLLGHVKFWSTQGRVDLIDLAPLVPLLLMGWIQSERRVWGAATATLLLVGSVAPASFSASALAVAAAFGARAVAAWWSGLVGETRSVVGAGHYRTGAWAESFVAVPCDRRAAAQRWFVGAAAALYLSLWTLGWSRGPWPAHALPLDLLLTAVAFAGARLAGARGALAPPAAAWLHFVWRARLIPYPGSLLEWGGVSVGLGFALLIGSLATSYWRTKSLPQEGPLRQPL